MALQDSEAFRTNPKEPMQLDARLGYRISLATAILTLATFILAILTPPLSGPACVSGCLDYPFRAMAPRFPRDYWWMYPALAVTALYAMLMACLHRHAPEGRKGLTLIGLLLASFAAVVILADYFVQVSVIQPSVLAGETEGIALISQYNPHGIFIALEELGYLLMGFSFPWMAAALPGRNRIERTARWTLHGGFVLILAAFAGITAAYGIRREYRFEIAVISIDWLVLLIVASLAAVAFRRAAKSSLGCESPGLGRLRTL
jgi:hypothetical protein